MFVFSEDQLGYKFSETHPFNQKRLTLTVDLLREMNALSLSDIVAPRIATDEELSLIHDPHYIEIVKKQVRKQATLRSMKIMELEQKIPLFSLICMKRAQVLLEVP